MKKDMKKNMYKDQYSDIGMMNYKDGEIKAYQKAMKDMESTMKKAIGKDCMGKKK